MNFEELAKIRHSAVNFIEGEKMTEDDFKKIFELVKLAPSAYNLQPAHFLVITDEEKKQRVKELSYNQHKIGTSSAVILVYSDINAALKVESIYKPMNTLGMIDDAEYNHIVREVVDGFKHTPEDLRLRNAYLNAMTAATTLLYAAKYYGFDTCPMHIHSTDIYKEEFNVPNGMVPVMMITIGKSVDKTRPRGYRKPFKEFVSFNSFK